MALPLGKLTIIVGAGIIGSVLVKEGGSSTVSDVFSGAFKIVWRQLKHNDSAPARVKPRNDSLLAQVDSLRQELQLLASNRSITIVSSSGSGSNKFGAIVVVVVVGYGYIWWKGWKLPSLMFATRRSLSDACGTISKQLEHVYSSIAATESRVSSKIDHLDVSVDECRELSTATRDKVSELQGEMNVIGVDVHSVSDAVRTLESKINRIEVKQSLTNEGVRRLVDYAWRLENSQTTERIQGASSSSSKPALELPGITASSRTESLPPIPSIEPASPSAPNGSHKRSLQHTVSAASGLKELDGISEPITTGLRTPDVSNRGRSAEEQPSSVNNPSAGSGIFNRTFSGISASFLARTRSAVQPSKLDKTPV